MTMRYAALGIGTLTALLLILKFLNYDWLDGNNHRPMKRYLIYTCREENCGGVADHLGGMMTVFDIAMKTNRIFGVEESKRCSPLEYLRPHYYNWAIHQKELSHMPSIFISTIQDDESEATKSLRARNNSIINAKENVVFLQTDIETSLKHEIGNYGKIYKQLFLVDGSIENELIFFRQSNVVMNETVCAHIRTGKQPGFNDTYYNNLGNISSIWEFLSRYDKKGYVIFVASDSKEVKASAKRRFPQRVIEIPDTSKNTMSGSDEDALCLKHREVFLDLLFLARCDTLLLTYSGMGRIASLLRDKREEQFCFQNETEGVHPCPIFDLAWTRSKEEKLTFRGI